MVKINTNHTMVEIKVVDVPAHIVTCYVRSNIGIIGIIFTQTNVLNNELKDNIFF